jgi:putative salt-induced outer membrane protein YdiY
MLSKLTCGALVAASAVAYAQPAPAWEKGKREDIKGVEEVAWTAKAEAGLVSTTGNSKTLTMTASANVTRKDHDNKVDLRIDGTFARATTRVAADANANGVIDADELSTATATSAESATAKLRYDRYLTEADAVYAAALATVDRPAGKEFLGGVQVGYSRGLYKSERHELLGEVGYDLTYLRLLAADSVTIHSLRGFGGYKGKLNESTAAEASLEALFNVNTVTIGVREAGAFEDTRLNGMVGLTTTMSERLSLAASFTAKFDNVPAPLAVIGGVPFAPGFVPVADKLDTIAKISLIVTFL